MFVIMVYDVNVKRVAKVLKISRRYLARVQNSVFEGEITPGRLESLKSELNRVIDNKGDSVLFYTLSSKRYIHRDSMGVNKVFIDEICMI